MIYSIFRNNILIVQVKPLDNSELSQKKQSEDLIRLNFNLDTLVNFEVGDYIIYDNKQYRMKDKPRVIESPKNFQYECIFLGDLYKLSNTKIFLITEHENGQYKDYKFSILGTAQTFLNFIVDNLNRNGGNFSVGACVNTGSELFDFNNWNALEAINTISEKFGFSWYLENDILNFDAPNISTSIVLQVGNLLGLEKLTRFRVEKEIQTVVYGYGSTENLPPRILDEGITYDSQLLSENRLCFEGVDGDSRLEKNVDLYGRIESIQEFDIKPEYIGTITGIDEDDVTIFIDEGLDFDVELQKLPDLKPQVKFLSGLLSGLTFDISCDYAHKQITMDLVSGSEGTFPNDQLKPQVGDTYTFLSIFMPQSYIDDAKTRLQDKTQEYLDINSKELESFSADVDNRFVRQNNIYFRLGMLIRIVSPAFLIDNTYEITGITRKINKPSENVIQFGDILPKGLLAALKNLKFSTKQEVYNVAKNTYSTTEINNINQVSEWLNL